MRSERTLVSLGDHVELATGYPFKSSGYTTEAGAIRLLRGDNVAQGVLRWEDAKRWSAHDAQTVQMYALREDDVVLAMDRPWISAGLKFAHIRRSDLPCLLVQRVARLRAKQGLDSRFLRYIVGSKKFTDYILSVQTGTAVPHISANQIAAFKFVLPPIEEQQEVGELLGAFDDRIDLLRQTNSTLESIAHALFKSWFIDFGPVRAKAEGREPEGMDAATAALFPAELEESALGAIPKGWSAGSVYEVASVIYGAPFASKQFNTDGHGQPLVRIRDLRDEAPGVWTPEVHPKGYLIRPGDIVVGMDGEFRAYLWGGESAWLNQRVCCFQPIAPHGAAYIRGSIAAPLAHIEATEVATTVIHLGKGDIDRFRVVVPTPEVAKAFSELTAPLYARIVANKALGRNLAAARDTLLPRLVSGKLSLPEVQAEVEEMTA